MNVLITGSSGFLGSHCAKHFKQLGHSVIGVDITPSITTDIVLDVRTYIAQSQTHFDLLLHFAAEVGGRENIETNYLQIMANIELDRMMFEWAISHVMHMIYPSSSAVYPVTYQNKPNSALSESMVDFKNNCIGLSDHLYGWCKLSAERMLWQIHQTTDLQIHILRPFSGYGPGQSTQYPMSNLINVVKTTPNNLQVWGNGEQSRDWVHVADILNTIEWCANDTTGYLTLNVGTGVATTFNQLIKQIYNIVYQKDCPEIKTLINKPMGVQHRVADTNTQAKFNILPQINLAQGIHSLL